MNAPRLDLPFLAACFFLFAVLHPWSPLQLNSIAQPSLDSQPALERMPTPQEWIDLQVPAAVQRIEEYLGDSVGTSKRTLHIVYWTPSDREPSTEYRERLTRLMKNIQGFYRQEMSRLGFGEKTFDLDLESDGLLRIHLVHGSGPYAKYDVQSGALIRRECLPTLQKAGITADQETIVIFCNMSNWDPKSKRMSQNSPYYAGGGLRSGTAWQVDSPLLDPDWLSSKEPRLMDAQYGDISIGKYNSIFVGGVCHELGHALGLPHNMERPDERLLFGTALMGSGNRTYGDALRNEGKGTFLTLGEGLRLASHPLFTRSEKGINLRQNATISDVQVVVGKDRQSFTIHGKVSANPPPYAVLGYMDPVGGSDYDATTMTAIPSEDGMFTLPCYALKKNSKGSLRLVVCQVNGGRIDDKTLEIPYAVASDGTVDLQSYLNRQKLEPVIQAVLKRDNVLAQSALTGLRSSSPMPDESCLEIATNLAASLTLNPTQSASDFEGNNAWLSELKPENAKVGWGRPTFNRLPDLPVSISVGGQTFARGIYAHAPSRFVYHLRGKWKNLVTQCGVADLHDGSVEFVILGDGKELWRSKKTTEGMLQIANLDLSEIQSLELLVEDGNDGNGSDWGVWVDPKLER